MLLINTVSARDVQRQYKKIFAQVKKTKQPIVVISNNKPQAAIVSLEMIAAYERAADFTVLEKIWTKNKAVDVQSAEADIVKLVGQVRQELYDRKKADSH